MRQATQTRLTDSGVIYLIHAVRELDRKWRRLSVEDKRLVIERLHGVADEQSVLAAMKCVRGKK